MTVEWVEITDTGPTNAYNSTIGGTATTLPTIESGTPSIDFDFDSSADTSIDFDYDFDNLSFGYPGPPGPQGAQGPAGPAGPQGPQGPAAVGGYRHVQEMPVTTWDVIHNLGFFPNITVVDSAGSVVEGEIDYIDRNNVRLRFSEAFAGCAYLS